MNRGVGIAVVAALLGVVVIAVWSATQDAAPPGPAPTAVTAVSGETVSDGADGADVPEPTERAATADPSVQAEAAGGAELAALDPDAGEPAEAELGDTAEGAEPDGEPAPAEAEDGPPDAPTLDLVRVDDQGQMVLAGRARPNELVEIVLGGEVIGTVEAGGDGSFATVLDAAVSDEGRALVVRVAREDVAEAGTGAGTDTGGDLGADGQTALALADPDATAPEPDEPAISEPVQADPDAAEPEVTEPAATEPEAGGETTLASDPGEAETKAAEAEPATPTPGTAVEPEVPEPESPAAAVAEPDAASPEPSEPAPSSAALAEGSVPEETTGDAERGGGAPEPVAATDAVTDPATADAEALAGAAADAAQHAGEEVANQPSTVLGGSVPARTSDPADTAALTEAPEPAANPEPEPAETEVAETEVAVLDPDQPLQPGVDGDESVGQAEPGKGPGDLPEPRIAYVESAPVIILPGDDGDSGPLLVRTGPDEVTLEQTRERPLEQVVLDQITYPEGGDVMMSGRGAPGHVVRVYVNANPVTEVEVSASGAWTARLTSEQAKPARLLRFDEIGPGGDVTSRIETPFRYAADGGALELRQREVVIQRGDYLWRIAEQHYGEGIRYSVIYDANAELIRDPDLIYPGQVFKVPELVGAQ